MHTNHDLAQIIQTHLLQLAFQAIHRPLQYHYLYMYTYECHSSAVYRPWDGRGADESYYPLPMYTYHHSPLTHAAAIYGASTVPLFQQTYKGL